MIDPDAFTEPELSPGALEYTAAALCLFGWGSIWFAIGWWLGVSA